MEIWGDSAHTAARISARISARSQPGESPQTRSMDGTTAPPPRAGPASVMDATGVFMVAVTILAFFLPLLLYFPPLPPSQRDALLETHVQVGVAPANSALRSANRKRADAARNAEKESKSSSSSSNTTTTTTTTTTIRSLWIYPIKSCRGIELRQSKVLATGLEFDRLYTLAQRKSSTSSASSTADSQDGAPDWHFITQRQFPLLATVSVDLFVPDVVKARGNPSSASAQSFLLVRFPWRAPGLRGAAAWLAAKLTRGWSAQPEMEFVLPAAFPENPEDVAARGYRRATVAIWKDVVEALDMSSELPPELGQYLGVPGPLALLRVDPARLRTVRRCAPTATDAGYQPVTGFQDAYPLHMLNLTSVRDFEAKIEKDDDFRELDPRRFRANIIVDGGETPYDEETWKKIRFLPAPGSTRAPSTFHVSCRTVRCKLPNVDPDTGLRHKAEPDRALRKYREVDEGAPHKGCMGMQMTPLFPGTSSSTKAEDLESWVEVGMPVEVLERGDHRYIPQ
ncbi:hypothetical protein VTJ49DRAFT_3906 [Mycothermus thermophilus]|uniref:MOSC domain-containing protein n=1 Tax=Humicola insolens TaxID=85995 RepID=A0ABR3VLX8_HUMIN